MKPPQKTRKTCFQVKRGYIWFGEPLFSFFIKHGHNIWNGMFHGENSNRITEMLPQYSGPTETKTVTAYLWLVHIWEKEIPVFLIYGWFSIMWSQKYLFLPQCFFCSFFPLFFNFLTLVIMCNFFVKYSMKWHCSIVERILHEKSKSSF